MDIRVIENRSLSTLPSNVANENAEKIINLYLNSLNSENTKITYSKSIYEFFVFIYGTSKITLREMVVDPQQAFEYSNFWKKKFIDSEIKAIEPDVKKQEI
jgi:hypothetical protein